MNSEEEQTKILLSYVEEVVLVMVRKLHAKLEEVNLNLKLYNNPSAIGDHSNLTGTIMEMVNTQTKLTDELNSLFNNYPNVRIKFTGK